MLKLTLILIAGLICFIASIFLIIKSIKAKRVWLGPSIYSASKERHPILFIIGLVIYLFFSAASIFITVFSYLIATN